jgi:hypothetical protein
VVDSHALFSRRFSHPAGAALSRRPLTSVE